MSDPVSDTPPATQPEERRSVVGKIVSVAVSALILVALYNQLDGGNIPEVLAKTDPWIATGGVLLIAPILGFVALRFRWIAPAGSVASYWEAVRLTLVALVLNLFVPAKLGDLSKSYFISKGREDVSAGVAISVVVFERGCDMFGLLTWCLASWALQLADLSRLSRSGVLVLAAAWTGCLMLIASARSAQLALRALQAMLPGRLSQAVGRLSDGWLALHAELAKRPGQRPAIALYSVALWLLHLTQIWLFTQAIGGHVPFAASLGLSSLAILSALVPFTFAGLGVRDVAFVVLFAAFLDTEQAAAVGILTSTRTFLPTLLALLIVRPYVATVMREASEWRRRLKE